MERVLEIVTVVAFWIMFVGVGMSVIFSAETNQLIKAERSDVNGDGIVDLQDVSIVMSNIQQ